MQENGVRSECKPGEVACSERQERGHSLGFISCLATTLEHDIITWVKDCQAHLPSRCSVSTVPGACVWCKRGALIDRAIYFTDHSMLVSQLGRYLGTVLS